MHVSKQLALSLPWFLETVGPTLFGVSVVPSLYVNVFEVKLKVDFISLQVEKNPFWIKAAAAPQKRLLFPEDTASR